jgi:hypothetical protein
LVRNTALGALLASISVFVFLFTFIEPNPYCDGGEDRIGCAMRLIGLTGLPTLTEAVIELVLVAVAIGVRRYLKPPARRLAVPASGA